MNTSQKPKSKIMVVEDERMLRLLARESLERAGFEVVEAGDGHEALKEIVKGLPDLILLDVKMPKMDGFQVCHVIRTTEAGRHVPILMMTGLEDVHSIERAYEVGATDFVNKPVNWHVLGHRVEYMLRSSQAAAELRCNRQQLARAQEIARLGTWEWLPEKRMVTLSPDLVAAIGLPMSASYEPGVLRDLIHTSDRDLLRYLFRCLAAGKVSTPFDFRVNTRTGDQRTFRQFQVEVSAVGDRITGALQDLTLERKQEEKIARLSYYDALTGLPNRRALEERLDYLARQSEPGMAAVLLFDLDRFQRINEGLGNSVGNRLLRLVAQRLGGSLRKRIDPTPASDAGNFLARVGGDEFVVVAGVSDAQEATAVAKRLRATFEAPFMVDSDEVSITASLGISLFPQDGGDSASLIDAADSALFRAKQDGRNRFDFYDDSLGSDTRERLRLENDLSLAIDRNQLYFLFQPQYEMAKREIAGLEALMRWEHHELGLVGPDRFIPIAEENGFDVVLGEWTVQEVARQVRAFIDQGFPVRIGLNLSARCLQNVDLVEWFERALLDTEIPASLLEVEITERTLLDESQVVLDNLFGLRRLGIGLALDDFGTGYSALSYLSRFPLDALKVDRSFVADAETSVDKRNLVSAIIAMTKKLGFKSIAEGIETEAQWALLREEGCAEAQGFLMSRPIGADAILELLAARTTDAAQDLELV
jgi:diguanylate cyclase (GGDEF)-like protein